jgi:hypothetical protein
MGSARRVSCNRQLAQRVTLCRGDLKWSAGGTDIGKAGIGIASLVLP